MIGSAFFSDFLQITSIRTILFMVVIFLLFLGLKWMEKRKVKFTIRMISSTVAGLALGLVVQWVAGFPELPSEVTWINEVMSWYGLVGYGFMDLLKMLIVPVVFLSIVRVIMNMNREEVGRLAVRSVAILLVTTMLSAIVGIVIGNLFALGIGMENVAGTGEGKEISSVVGTLRGLIPSNPVKVMADGNVIAIVIIAAFLGNAINRLKKKYAEEISPFVKWIEAFYKIITSVAMTIIKFMPYAVIALLANTIAGRGIRAIYLVIDFVLALYLSVLIVFVIHLVIITCNGMNPITYLRKVAKPLILAFTSRSSLGTLPVTIETLTDDVGVEKGISSFVASLGANMGMNGCAGIYPALMAVTIGNMAGLRMDFSFYAMLILVIAIGSLGIAGLPGTATMAVSVTLAGMGMGAYFPLAGGIIAIDPILDMGRTMLNVNGAMATTVTVANSIGKVDKEVFKTFDS